MTASASAPSVTVLEGPPLTCQPPLSDSPPFDVGAGPIAGRQSLAGEKRPHIGLDLVEVFLAGHRVTLDRQRSSTPLVSRSEWLPAPTLESYPHRGWRAPDETQQAVADPAPHQADIHPVVDALEDDAQLIAAAELKGKGEPDTGVDLDTGVDQGECAARSCRNC